MATNLPNESFAAFRDPAQPGAPSPVIGSTPTTPVSLQRTSSPLTPDIALWSYIRRRTRMLAFKQFQDVVDDVMCETRPGPAPAEKMHTSNMRLPFPGVDRYLLLKTATEIFMMTRCGVQIDAKNLAESIGDLTSSQVTEEQTLDDAGRVAPNTFEATTLDQLWNAYVVSTKDPVDTLRYLNLVRVKLKDVPIKGEDDQSTSNCFGILAEKLRAPCMIELIWSYWHEEAMLAQSMNALCLRFQNKRRLAGRDPLANLELDPLRPLSGILWGYVQDEQHRLRVERRAYEYDHHYGITLQGRAVPALKSADSRSKFVEAFHNLLNLCAVFYRQDDDTTMVADAFPVLNGLKALHLVLSQGAHNQYGELPWTSRQEMLIEEWLLARPEIREFLPSRIMVAYPEAWMDRVEAMKRFQGWDDTPVVHFRDLGVFGEQILLSIRFHSWSEVFDPNVAKNWARYWRPEVQGYMHGYRVVTGVDLTASTVDTLMPSVHLQRRLREQLRESLPAGADRRLLSGR